MKIRTLAEVWGKRAKKRKKRRMIAKKMSMKIERNEEED